MNAGTDRVGRAQEVAYRVMTALGGDRLGFEEALRARFAPDREGFERRIAPWPHDVRQYVSSRAEEAFNGSRETVVA